MNRPQQVGLILVIDRPYISQLNQGLHNEGQPQTQLCRGHDLRNTLVAFQKVQIVHHKQHLGDISYAVVVVVVGCCCKELPDCSCCFLHSYKTHLSI